MLTLLQGVVAAAHSEEAWICVCGEAAATVEGAAVFVGLGFDELSMATNAIPAVKEAVRQSEASELEEAVHRAMNAEDAAEARQIVGSALPSNKRSGTEDLWPYRQTNTAVQTQGEEPARRTGSWIESG